MSTIRRTTADGVDLLIVPEHTRPIAVFSLNVQAGLLHDPPGKEGLAWFTGQMLMRGTKSWTHEALSEELDFLGSLAGVAVGRDSTSLTGDALVRNFDDFEAICAAVLHEPTFPQAEIDKLKRRTIADLRQIKDNDESLGRHFFVHHLYDNHVYGQALRGTEKSLGNISRDDIVAFHAQHYRSAGTIAGFAGDIDVARAEQFAAATLGRLPKGAGPSFEVGPLDYGEGYRLTLVDKPDRSQTQVFIGHPAIHGNHPDYTALFVANTILGGTFTSRLSHEIREKRGWSYGAYSSVHGDQRMGSFMARFYPGTGDTVAALELADQLITDYQANGPTDEEVAKAIEYLVNAHPMAVETAEKELHHRLMQRLIGRPDDWLETYVARMKALTPDKIRAAAKAHLRPDDVTVTVVCTAAELQADLDAWGRPANVQILDYRTEI